MKAYYPLEVGGVNMGKKMVQCKHCGAEIAAGAKICPKCGGKNNKPFYKRPWFIVLVVILVLAAIGSAGGKNGNTSDNGEGTKPSESSGETQSTGSSQSEQVQITYTPYDVGTLMNDLNANALKAADTYRDQYVALTGRLNVIDSSGKYISITPVGEEFAIVGVQCYVKSDEQLEIIKNAAIGDTLEVKGKIKEVGEVMGYSMDIDALEVLK